MQHTLIVGGTRGLGREVARVLSREGHHVSVIGRREPIESDRDIPNAKYWIADLQQPGEALMAANSAARERGPFSYLVFCQRYRGKENDWSGEIQVSLSATKELIEGLLSQFTPDDDRGIVLVSSVFGDYVGEGQPLSYHLGKAGINQMARYYSVNLGKQGIRVNVVTPFTFLKEESKEFYLTNEELQALYRDIVPLGRMGTTEDSANAIAFLCSPRAGFISGQNIYIDGGLSAVWPETLARKLKSI
jgi:NAD(P)-dependent dehydrogenase (short-subunit alcohol dehydrogenase family)